MPEVIHESQTTYIPGRYVHDNLRSLDLIKQYCKSERLKGLMIGVDTRKAFAISVNLPSWPRSRVAAKENFIFYRCQ